MCEKQKKFVNKYRNMVQSYKKKLLIVLVMNVQGITHNYTDFDGTSVTSEYYSYNQYEEIFEAIRSLGLQVKCYFDENDFIFDIENRILRNHYPRTILVINSAQKGIGPGRKSLVPAFCQLHGILCASSNPYTVSFARSKYHWYCYLKEIGLPVCPSWYYTKRAKWLSNKRPHVDENVILKLNSESSSIGLTSKNIFKYDHQRDTQIQNICQKYNQDVIVEKFINGYEVEVPVLVSSTECCSLYPAGISVNNQLCLENIILDYAIRGQHQFSHFKFEHINPQISYELEKITEKVAIAMGIRNMGRVDFRIDKNGKYYITDIATNPHITKSMTFYYEFKNWGLPYEAVLETLIGLTLSWKEDDDI